MVSISFVSIALIAEEDLTVKLVTGNIDHTRIEEAFGDALVAMFDQLDTNQKSLSLIQRVIKQKNVYQITKYCQMENFAV